MPAEVIVRAMASADAPRVCAMARALNSHEGKPATPMDEAAVVRLALGPQPLFRVLVAECPDGPVGYALFYPGYDVDSGTAGTHLADIFVEAPWRRHGVGTRLVDAVADASRAWQGEWVEWKAMPGNAEATAFYDRIGARVVEVLTFEIIRDRMS